MLVAPCISLAASDQKAFPESSAAFNNRQANFQKMERQEYEDTKRFDNTPVLFDDGDTNNQKKKYYKLRVESGFLIFQVNMKENAKLVLLME